VIENIANLFRVPEIRRRLGITLGFLLLYRVGWNIPIPGVNLEVLRSASSSAGGNAFTALFGIISGGGIYSCALFSLGIMPYISASIIFSLLTKVVPTLEAVAKEGAAGQRKINQWTRLATVPLALIQAVILVANVYTKPLPGGLLDTPMLDPGFMLAIGAILTLTAGTILLMWVGEQITEYGVGNGISLLIMAGIIARVPQAIVDLVGREEGGFLPFTLLVLFFVIVFVVVFITKGQRKIPVQYAKLTRGRKVYGGQRHFLPLKVNQAGVMPVIFASALLSFPQLLGEAVGWSAMARAFSVGAGWYTSMNLVLIFFFSFFWNSLMFNPVEMSKNMKEGGSFIPGIRPGKRTAEFLERVMTRVTLAGATFLAIIATVPQQAATWISSGIDPEVAYFLGGTSILIVVSVALDLVDKLNSALLMRNQQGFMRTAGTRRRRKGK
jgi:preprotein translocase subunit SecY